MATELSNMTKAISNFCTNSKDKVQVLCTTCTKIGYQFDVTEARKQIYKGIEKLDKFDKLKAVTMIANDIKKMNVFFSLPNEFEAKWVALLLKGELQGIQT